MTKILRSPEPAPKPVYGPGGPIAHEHTRIGQMWEIGIIRFECWCGKVWFETRFIHCGYPEKVARLNQTLGREQQPPRRIS